MKTRKKASSIDSKVKSSLDNESSAENLPKKQTNK